MNSNRNRYASRWSPDRTVEAAELGRPHLRMRNPIVSGLLEGITQSLYDIYRVVANTAAIKLLLFAQPQGQTYNFGGVTAFAKTILHTNLVQAGMLQSPNKHIVRAISVMVSGIPGAAPNPSIAILDLLNFLHNTYFEFDVNQKPYCQSQVGRFPAGGGAFVGGGSATTVAATSVLGVAVNGTPSTQNTYALMHGGVNIEQTQNFSVLVDPTVEAGGAFTTIATNATAQNGGPGSGIAATIYLDGTLFRAVQ
jgi:hypothetical protein